MNIIKRYASPNKMDQCAKGTICVVRSAYLDKPEVWEQTNEDWENPIWVPLDNYDPALLDI